MFHTRLPIDIDGVAFGERPALCAARLFVEADRNVQREQGIGKVDTHALRRLIAAHAVADPVLAQADFEQERVIGGRRPCRSGARGQGMAE